MHREKKQHKKLKTAFKKAEKIKSLLENTQKRARSIPEDLISYESQIGEFHKSIVENADLISWEVYTSLSHLNIDKDLINPKEISSYIISVTDKNGRVSIFDRLITGTVTRIRRYGNDIKELQYPIIPVMTHSKGIELMIAPNIADEPISGIKHNYVINYSAMTFILSSNISNLIAELSAEENGMNFNIDEIFSKEKNNLELSNFVAKYREMLMGIPGEVHNYHYVSSKKEISAAIDIGITDFIIGHELSHLINRDFDIGESLASKNIRQVSEEKEFSDPKFIARMEESAADDSALMISLIAIQTEKMLFEIPIGLPTFLLLADYINIAIKKDKLGSHPSTNERLISLTKALKLLVDNGKASSRQLSYWMTSINFGIELRNRILEELKSKYMYFN